MKFFKKLSAGLAIGAAAVFSAQAIPVTVLGVTFDTDAPTDFSAQSINVRQMIDPNTGELRGFGIITAFNGTPQTTFCASGCELTFTFAGFFPVASTVFAVPGTLLPGAGQTITYNGGTVNVFADSTPEITNPTDYNALTFANTSDGAMFLTLRNNVDFLGTNQSNVLLSGLGFLDVAGGAAAAFFDTNTQQFGTDVGFTASFSFQRGSGISDLSGTANFVGDTRATTVPEPGSLALIGLGLVGLFATSRRRKSA